MMLNKLAVPIFILDAGNDSGFRFSFLNECYCRATGLNSAEIIGKTPQEFWPRRMAERLNSHYRKCRETRTENTYEEFLGLPSGEKWWQTTLSPVFDADGKVIQIYGVSADITERKLLELQQAKTHGELAHRSELLTTYTKTAAHDLRSPLCQLDMLMQMILIGFEDRGDGKKGLLERSKVVVENSIKYLDAVFDYSRSMAELGEGQSSRLEFGDLCGDLLSILDPNGIHDVDYQPARLCVDGTVTQVILRNLLDNAIKHNARRQLEIRIGVAVEKPGWLRFQVSDNGKGFADGFDIGDTPKTKNGNGFGLKGARRLVAGAGGRLWLREENEGASICFTLPGKFMSEDKSGNICRKAEPVAVRRNQALAA